MREVQEETQRECKDGSGDGELAECCQSLVEVSLHRA